jgi:hypothetical protein
LVDSRRLPLIAATAAASPTVSAPSTSCSAPAGFTLAETAAVAWGSWRRALAAWWRGLPAAAVRAPCRR